MAHYEQALAINPDLVEAYNNLGNIFKSQGKFDDAMTQFGRAIAIRLRTMPRLILIARRSRRSIQRTEIWSPFWRSPKTGSIGGAEDVYPLCRSESPRR